MIETPTNHITTTERKPYILRHFRCEHCKAALFTLSMTNKETVYLEFPFKAICGMSTHSLEPREKGENANLICDGRAVSEAVHQAYALANL